MTMTDDRTDLTADEQRVSELVDELLASFPPATTDPKVFLGAQFDRGSGLGALPRGQRRSRA